MEIHINYPLKQFNTFGIAATAGRFAAITSEQALQELLRNKHFRHPELILGGGSNILLVNSPQTVLKNDIKGIEIVKEDDKFVYVKAGAGENWHRFVLYCISRGWAGVENLPLIPGNVGASPMQNIGAYGVEVKDIFYALEAFHIEDKEAVTFYNKDCHFSYRTSVSKNKYKEYFVIMNVTYRLLKKPEFHTSYGAIQKELEAMGIKELSIEAISDAVINIRSAKLPDPAKIGNSGSFFKNPIVSKQEHEKLKSKFPELRSFPFEDGYKLAAAWLIDQCGWKGYREGSVGVHDRQALVLVNYGGAKGRE